MKQLEAIISPLTGIVASIDAHPLRVVLSPCII